MEQAYPLRPLQVPVLNGNNQVERLQGYPSMDLFCQRAKAVKPNFQLDNRNVVDVANICHRLDGLPLAIELAAARIKIFSPTHYFLPKKQLQIPISLTPIQSNQFPN